MNFKTKKMNQLTQEYNDFMEWFKLNHPELYEKYGRNIAVPFQEGGGVTVNNSFKLPNDEYEMLLKVANTYYYGNK